MTIEEAIEKLKRLPPTSQAKVVRVINEEADASDDRVPRCLRSLRDNPVEDWPADLSEKRADFTGRGFEE